MLSVGEFTIDAGGEGPTPAVAQEVASHCDELGFARIVNFYDQAAFETLAHEANRYYETIATRGLLRGKGRRGYRYTLAPRMPVILEEEFPEFLDITQQTSAALHTAGQDSERIAIPHSKLSVFQVNNYLPGQRIGRHYDNDSGVTVITSTKGNARTTLMTARARRFLPGGVYTTAAEFTSGPNEALVLPASVGERGGMRDQTWHSMANVTPLDLVSGGVRQSVPMVYGADQNFYPAYEDPSAESMQFLKSRAEREAFKSKRLKLSAII